MHIHATTVHFFVNVAAASADDSKQRLSKALDNDKTWSASVETELENDGRDRTIFRVTCASPQAGAVMRAIEALKE